MRDLLLIFGGAAATWLTSAFFKRTLGTSYRTQKQCDICSVRASMGVIRAMVVELAIKAGVPAQEVAKIVNSMPGGCQ